MLAEILGLALSARATFAGGLLGGHHMGLGWHQRLGDFIVIVRSQACSSSSDLWRDADPRHS
jgi:hypothetical protein